MSIKKHHLYIFLILFLVLITGFFIFPKKTTHHFSFASYNVSQYSSQGLVDRIIQLKIETRHQKEIEAQISLPFDYNESLEYKWKLGQGLQLIEGSLTGKINQAFKKDEVFKIKIKVQGFTPDFNRHIAFEVFGFKNHRRLYADALISSQYEKSFEYTVQNVERLKAQMSGATK